MVVITKTCSSGDVSCQKNIKSHKVSMRTLHTKCFQLHAAAANKISQNQGSSPSTSREQQKRSVLLRLLLPTTNHRARPSKTAHSLHTTPYNNNTSSSSCSSPRPPLAPCSRLAFARAAATLRPSGRRRRPWVAVRRGVWLAHRYVSPCCSRTYL